MNKFDASVPRKMFWSKDVSGTDFCPQCHSRLENESHSYLLLVREGGETQPFIIGSDYGFFCAHCPVVVLDYEGFGQLASAGNPQSHSFEFIVPGIVDLDAVPEDKSDITLGDDDNPVPLVRFTNYSDQELAKRKRLRGDLRKLHRKRQHRRH